MQQMGLGSPSRQPDQGEWAPEEEAQASSNWRELIAVGKSISYFQDQVSGHHVLVDTSTTVAYVNKGAQKPILNQDFDSDMLVGIK